jgi:hypothetical protein
MEKKTWNEFLQTELLWWINRSLHLFGWVIVVEKDTETKEVVSVYPAKTSYRGFSREDEEKGFIGLTKYLAENAKKLEENTNA